MNRGIEDVRRAIRDIPDFPKPGIIFKDITPVLEDPGLFRAAVDSLSEPFTQSPPDLVACVEARGFVLGAAAAYRLGSGVVMIRKAGKLPHKTRSLSFQLEYGEDTIEVHEDSIRPGARVLVVDDLLATGGTLAAAVKLVESSGAELAGISVLVELDFLKGREKLAGRSLHSLIHY